MKKKSRSGVPAPPRSSKTRLPLNRFPIKRLPLETLQAFVRFKLEEAKGGVRTLAPAPDGMLKSVEALPLWMSFAEYLKEAAELERLFKLHNIVKIPCPCGCDGFFIGGEREGDHNKALTPEQADLILELWKRRNPAEIVVASGAEVDPDSFDSVSKKLDEP